MIEPMNQTITTLRAYIVALRASYKADICGRTTSEFHCNPTLHDRAGKSQARLAYLVPLYDAMHAAVQQAGTDAVGGVKQYVKRYDMLEKLIRKVAPYEHDSVKYFEGDVLALNVLVPLSDVPVEDWAAVSISALIAQVKQQMEDENHARLARARAAETARVAFIASLSVGQRVLLTHALDLAKSKGSHAITVNARDLEA